MLKNIDYYLSKGFDRKMAEYFVRGRRTITNVTPNDDFTLTLSFDNGELRRYDMRPMLKVDTAFSSFMDIENFKRVYLDDEHCVSWDINPEVDSSVVWSNKIDICPDTCYVDSMPI